MQNNSTTSNVVTSAGAAGLATSLSILLMWALNDIFGMTFPPEVSIAFSTVLGAALHFTCAKIGGCDLPGDDPVAIAPVPPAYIPPVQPTVTTTPVVPPTP